MLDASSPIGVMDAGLGGFTVVRHLQSLLPHENIIYFGEGVNQPYGNRTEADILHLSRQILRFLRDEGVKVVAVACNTISTLADRLQPDFGFKIFSIVQAGADDVVSLGLSEAGVLSTVFTAQTGAYARLIREQSPNTRVWAQGCPWLARIIEDGELSGPRLEAELKSTLGKLAAAHPSLDSLVLGCTHYPLIQNAIRALYPQFSRLIDPAASQARMVAEYLTGQNALNEHGEGRLRVCATAGVDVYRRMAGLLDLKNATFELAPAPVPLGK